MTAAEYLTRVEAEAAAAVEKYEAGYDLDIGPTLDVPRMAAALRAVLKITEATHDIPGSIRAMTCAEIETAIAAALDVTP